MFFSLSICYGQLLSTVFTSVDTLALNNGAYSGSIEITGTNVTPIISSTCGFNIKHFGVASTYGSGKTMAIAHESIISNGTLPFQDNELFFTQAFNWLSNGISSSNILLKKGWITDNNSTSIKTQLQSLGYSFSSTNSNLTSTLLTNIDILILGNDWNGNLPYSTSEINAVKTFVNNGGSILILGLGWSWPNNINDYPMNSIAHEFNYHFSTDGINESTFTNFHPTDTSFSNCFSPFLNSNIARGDTLRELKIAVSSTGEFTQENGGIANTKILIESWLEELNLMYGREYALRFKLIPNNDDLIFSNANTDPWTTIPLGSGGCNNAGLIDQENVIDSIIGYQNYDISHVIISPSHLNGGCASSFTFGISGGLNIPITRHEIGHQFGQSHTINHTDNSNYEPENGGWTLQGGNNQGRAHGHSYHQLAQTLNNNPNLGEKLSTGNTIPTIDAGLDYFIPKNTPFTLKAQAFDPDPNDSLTYVWDNMDKGVEQYIPVPDDRQGALFMRLLPTSNNTRTFPKIEDILLGQTSNSQEQLPSQARHMNIRVTVNDNHTMNYFGNNIPVSGINSDDLRLIVTEQGPLEVTSQSFSGISYTGLETPLVEWNVNQTDLAPISVSHVKISLSTDGGITFPIILNPSTLNDGSEMVQIPEINTNQARIKVEAINNIFFNINSKDFKITYNVGIENNFNSSFNIYPNPAKNQIIITNNSIKEDYQFQISNIQGKILWTGRNTKFFNSSFLSNGLYFITLKGFESNSKLVKKIEIIK